MLSCMYQVDSLGDPKKDEFLTWGIFFSSLNNGAIGQWFANWLYLSIVIFSRCERYRREEEGVSPCRDNAVLTYFNLLPKLYSLYFGILLRP